MDLPTIVEVTEGRSDLCREVLDDLPDWFGIPDAKARYVEAAAGLPMLGCRIGADRAGFASLRLHTGFAAEVHVIGVKRRHHRQGVGRALIEAAERFCASRGLAFLTVKTLAPSHPSPHYAATRRFYEALGFVPIEVLPTLWGPANPCLLMLKPLSPPADAGRHAADR